MSSLSYARIYVAPPLSISFRHSKTTRVFSSSSVVQQQTSSIDVPSEVDTKRLEPRVEEREGFFVLKEKFRQGINPQEKIKIEKEPLKLFVENGIEDLAKLSMEEIDQIKDSKDDIDVRLKWLDLFHRRKHQYGRFMMRLKLPNGVTTSEQTRYLANVIRKYGKDGYVDVTTRQNWKIRSVVLPDVPDILKGLAGVGLA